MAIFDFVSSAEETVKFPRSNVKFYSLKTNDYVNILRFKSPVYTIECNQRILFVVCSPRFVPSPLAC